MLPVFDIFADTVVDTAVGLLLALTLALVCSSPLVSPSLFQLFPVFWPKLLLTCLSVFSHLFLSR